MSEESVVQSRLHAIVHGIVQGVNFRSYTRREAVGLGLSGWVRNRSDGTVETIAEGTKSALNTFLDILHQGPPSASVTQVDATWESPTGEFAEFQVRYF